MYELILQHAARHISLTKEEEEYFISILRHKKIRKRQYIVQAGEMCRFEMFIIKGCLRQYYVDESGQEHVVMLAVEDWWISDMYGLITCKPSLTNIDALEDSEVLAIEKKDFDTLLDKYPKFEKMFRQLLQRAFAAHQRRIIENMSLPAEQRYKRFIEQYPQIVSRVPQKQIASYLGITPESLSRIRKQMMGK